MSAVFEKVSVQQPKALHCQVRDQVRELIHSGDLKPGDRLPSTHELAREFATHVPTVHTALTNLAREGLVVRIPNKGTYVARPTKKLTCVGMYYPSGIWGQAGSLYLQSVHTALEREAARQGIELDVWHDPRPRDAASKPWPPLLAAAQHREFQAVIVPGTDREMLRWLQKLPVPVAVQSTTDHPCAVRSDLGQLATLSLRALAQQGCRSVGLIAPVPTTALAEEGRHQFEEFYERFNDVSRDLGLRVRNQWMRVGQRDARVTGCAQEKFGYDQFLELWAQSSRPDGLVAWPDTVARGAILGAHVQQVRVPDELKLVLAKNQHGELLCPFPATLVVQDEAEVAAALFTQVQKQFRGEPCTPIHIGFTVLPAAGVGKP